MSVDLDPRLAARIEAIAADHESGASRLTRMAVAILVDAHRAGEDTLDAAASALCLAQPTMGSVWHAAALAVGPRGSAPLQLQRLSMQLERAPRTLARLLSDLLLTRQEGEVAPSQPVVVATVSASESVRICLEALSEQVQLRVICAEARPLLEGRQIATHLAAAGIPTTVCTDAGIGAVMAASEAQLEAVVVGADAVAPRWFVNKCGTRNLVDVATGLGVPSYVVASRDKFIDETLADILRPTQGLPAEVWDAPPHGVAVANPYFERIPVESVATFVTDIGPVGPGSVPELCGSVVCPEDSIRLAQQIRLSDRLSTE